MTVPYQQTRTKAMKLGKSWNIKCIEQLESDWILD